MSQDINTRFGNIMAGEDGKKTQNKEREGPKLIVNEEADPCTFSFDGMTGIQAVTLNNYQIRQYLSVSLSRTDEGYRVIIRYGTIGRKCAKPLVTNFTSRPKAVEYANRTVQDKKRRGYITEIAHDDGVDAYVRKRS